MRRRRPSASACVTRRNDDHVWLHDLYHHADAERCADPRLWYAPWLFEGQHACMAGLATSGTLTHWFRDQFAKELSREEAFPFCRGSGVPPRANGLVMLPYFSGERTPIHDPSAKGTLIGLNLTHTRGDVYRAMLEGIALGTGHVIETYRDAGRRRKSCSQSVADARIESGAQATSDVLDAADLRRKTHSARPMAMPFWLRLRLACEARRHRAWNPRATD